MKRTISLTLCFIICISLVFNSKNIVNANFIDKVNVSASTALLINMENDQIIFEKNSNAKVFPASLTKILTTIVVLENVKDIDKTIYTANYDDFDEFVGINISNADIRSDEQLTVRQLLYASMLQSANEAANVLARNVFGSREKFILEMNNTAKRVGATNSNFVNPHGLFDEKQYTTAGDMYKITKHALQIPVFKDIAFSSTYDIPATNKHKPRRLTTTVLMQDRIRGGSYYRSYIKGVKTGTLPEAGRNVITTATINNVNYLSIVMNAPINDTNGVKYPHNKSFTDTIAMFNWVRSNLKKQKVAETDVAIAESKVSLTSQNDFVLLYPKDNYSVVIPKDTDDSVVKKTFNIGDKLKAPLKSGDVVGTVTFSLFDKDVGQVDLIVAENVKLNYLLLIIDTVKNVLSSTIVKIILTVLAIASICYVYMTIKINKKRGKKIKRSKKTFKRRKF